MKKCIKCFCKIKYSVGIQNTNIAFPVLVDKKLYDNDNQLIGVCNNPKCPNYGLLQISNEMLNNINSQSSNSYNKNESE